MAESSEREGEEGSEWYFSRKELEENTPSRRDGIDAKKENELRRSYCGFMQALGMRLSLPQETIATAIVFCHRFFLRQSHAKNDMLIIAISCIHLAGKVKETRHRIRDVVLVSAEMLPRDKTSLERLRSDKEAFEQLRDTILLAERIVLVTINFDMYVRHPYRIVMKAIRKLQVPKKKGLCQVAWNFTSDGLQTSLCLQFRPTHIAAAVVYLASRFLKMTLLPLDWWKWSDFDDVTERQIWQVCFQVLDLYEQAGVSRLQRDGSGCSTDINPRTISVVSVGRDKTHGGTNAMVLVGKDETRKGKNVIVSIHKDITSRGPSSVISIDKGRISKDKSHVGKSEGGTSSMVSVDIDDNTRVGSSTTLGRLKPWDFVGTFHKSDNHDHEQSLKEQLKQRLLQDEEAKRESFVEYRKNLLRSLGLLNSSSDDDIDEERENNSRTTRSKIS
ncbi:Cyclin-T1-4, partial [Mucuna pruriens]